MITSYHYHYMLHRTDIFFPINIQLGLVPISLKIGGSAMQINIFFLGGGYYAPSSNKEGGGNLLRKK